MDLAQIFYVPEGLSGLIVLIVMVLIHALILKVALGLVVRGPVTYGQSLGALLAAWFVSVLLWWLLHPLVQGEFTYLIVLAVNVLVTLGVIANVVQTTMLRALAGVLLAAVLEFVLFWLVGLLLAGAAEAEAELDAAVRMLRVYG